LSDSAAAVRALLVHEFPHWFYIATRVVNGSESREKDGGTLDLRNEGLAESDTQINAQDGSVANFEAEPDKVEVDADRGPQSV
jgi:hypothetical protein